MPLASALRVKRFTLPDGINAAREQELSRRIIHTVWRQTARGQSWSQSCARKFLLPRRLPSPLSSWSANGLRRRIGAATAAAIRITFTRRCMRRLSGTTALMLGTMALSLATPGATMEVRIPQRGTFNASERCAGLRNPDQRRQRVGAAMVRADATSDLTGPTSVPCSWPGFVFGHPDIFAPVQRRGWQDKPDGEAVSNSM